MRPKRVYGGVDALRSQKGCDFRTLAARDGSTARLSMHHPVARCDVAVRASRRVRRAHDEEDWTPGPGVSWQLQLSGRTERRVKPKVFDIDGFDNNARVVRRLHRMGRRPQRRECSRPSTGTREVVSAPRPDVLISPQSGNASGSVHGRACRRLDYINSNRRTGDLLPAASHACRGGKQLSDLDEGGLYGKRLICIAG